MNRNLIVMSLTTCNKNIILVINFIDKSMLMSDSSRPVTCLIKLEKFRFANSLKWSALYTFKNFQYLFKDLLVVNRPIAKIIKGFTLKIKLSHLLKRKSLVKDSNSSSENEIVSLFPSRFLIVSASVDLQSALLNYRSLICFSV